MIVHFPTAYFVTVIPGNPRDAGNVTWTCSSTSPPRSNLFVDQTSPLLAVSLERVGALRPGDLARRSTRGGLVFTINAASSTMAVAGTRRYEAGQVLEFDAEPEVSVLEPQLVAPASETRHDTNYLDLEALGFTDQEVDAIMFKADEVTRTLISQLNLLRQQRADVETNLTNTQLAINEAIKAQAALTAVLAVSPGADIQLARDRVTAKIIDLRATQEILVASGNEIAAQAQIAQDTLVAATQLVR